MKKRLADLQEWLKEIHADGVFINDPGSIAY
ncbi:hypothetical protein, partial [Carnobacterium sp.]